MTTCLPATVTATKNTSLGGLSRTMLLIIVTVFTCMLTLLYFYFPDYYQNVPIAKHILSTDRRSSEALGVASSIHVISLARRSDRRETMERLRKGLRLSWVYFDALDKQDTLVNALLRFTVMQREQVNTTLNWPPEEDINYNHILTDVLREFRIFEVEHIPDPLLCATDDNTIPWYSNDSTVPYHFVLSRGMLACWFSHLSLIAEIATNTKDVQEELWDGRSGSAVVFEDDVDMEWDIQDRLTKMWPDLPAVWDIVFLGHCWSNETYHPAIAQDSPLHPSHKPKCTHGYVISPFGARRLLTYLAFPPFAFSRALDQAMSYLVVSGKLRAYSVVPAIVAQRRCAEGQATHECVGNSDIWQDSQGNSGSRWRDRLEDSALARIMNSDSENS